MSDLKICRICLRTEAKMYNFNLCQLKFYYEEVMALKVNEEDGLPRYFCYECATILHKFHKFKEKCYIGQKTLKELKWKGPISYEVLYKIDREDLMLNSPLTIMTVSNRVKTFTTTDSKQKNESQLLPKIENVEVDYLSETSFTDRDDINELTEDEKINNDNDINIANDNELNTLNDCKINNENDNLSDENNDIASSPTPAYMEAENGKLVTDCVELKDVRRGKQSNVWKSTALNDKNNWKISVLSEDEALKEFRAKAEDKKYLSAAFKCTECFKGFSKKNMLDRHVQLRHIEVLGNHECRFCRYRYRLDCYLKRHMKQHYTRYNCLRCDLQCSLDSTAVLHEAYHSGITRKCKYCDEEFRHSSTYYTHLRTHRSEHVCSLCGASFVSRLGLHQHKLIKHVFSETESPDDDEEVNTYCKRCDIRFETRKAYEEHLFHSALHSDDEAKNNSIEDDNESKSDSSEKVSVSKKVLGKKEKAKITKQLRKRRSDDDQFDVKRFVTKRYKRKERRQRTKPTTCHQMNLTATRLYKSESHQ